MSLGENEFQHFEQDGFVTLSSLIDAEEIERLRSLGAGFLRKDQTATPEAHQVTSLPVHSHEFRKLMVAPALLSFVSRALGPNFRISLVELCNTEPEPSPVQIPECGAPFEKHSHLGFHRDGGLIGAWDDRVARQRLSLKAAIWLTDVAEEHAGNLLVIPGSHLDPQKALNAYRREDARPVLAHAAQVTFFDRRLVHSRSPNKAAAPRMVLFVEYCLRWVKRKQSWALLPEAIGTLTDIERQMFAEETDPWELYWPSADLATEAV